jgi:hypothetical protein
VKIDERITCTKFSCRTEKQLNKGSLKRGTAGQDFSARLEPKTFFLEGPYRIVLYHRDESLF